MRYLRNFILNESFKQISFMCKKYYISNWTLNEDGTIDVDGDIHLNIEGLVDLPLRFRNVSGGFDCSRNKLKTLEGSPKSVGGNFNCSLNSLISLKGAPESVGGSFYGTSNQLKSLKYCPQSVSDVFDCSNNQLTSLEYCPELVGGYFDCSRNKLASLKGSPQLVGGYFACQNNQIRDFEGISIVDGHFYCDNNPIHRIWKLFEDINKIELLNDYDAIRGDEIILDRLNDFLRVIGKDPVREVKGYKCI